MMMIWNKHCNKEKSFQIKKFEAWVTTSHLSAWGKQDSLIWIQARTSIEVHSRGLDWTQAFGAKTC